MGFSKAKQHNSIHFNYISVMCCACRHLHLHKSCLIELITFFSRPLLTCHHRSQLFSYKCSYTSLLLVLMTFSTALSGLSLSIISSLFYYGASVNDCYQDTLSPVQLIQNNHFLVIFTSFTGAKKQTYSFQPFRSPLLPLIFFYNL